MENEIEQPAAVEAESDTEQETPEEELAETTDWKAEALKARRIASRYRNKVTKLSEAKVETKPESKSQETDKPENNPLVQKTYLRAAGISAADEVELALTTAKKWGMGVDQLVDDEDFQVKLDKLRTTKTNLAATSNVKGGAGGQESRYTPEYWITKGAPPSASDVPNRKERAKIARAMMASTKNSKTFYND